MRVTSFPSSCLFPWFQINQLGVADSAFHSFLRNIVMSLMLNFEGYLHILSFIYHRQMKEAKVTSQISRPSFCLVSHNIFLVITELRDTPGIFEISFLHNGTAELGINSFPASQVGAYITLLLTKFVCLMYFSGRLYVILFNPFHSILTNAGYSKFYLVLNNSSMDD
jgi:hypothetical protein